MQGTSMATPLIAGAAALVRQYFQQGMYPTGAPTTSNQFNPSGPLVKAVLIGGAAGLSGFEPDTGLPLAPPPSFRQGFGRLQLSQSLPLQVQNLSQALLGQTQFFHVIKIAFSIKLSLPSSRKG